MDKCCLCLLLNVLIYTLLQCVTGESFVTEVDANLFHVKNNSCTVTFKGNTCFSTVFIENVLHELCFT